MTQSCPTRRSVIDCPCITAPRSRTSTESSAFRFMERIGRRPYVVRSQSGRWIRPEKLDEPDQFRVIKAADDSKWPIDVRIPLNLTKFLPGIATCAYDSVRCTVHSVRWASRRITVITVPRRKTRIVLVGDSYASMYSASGIWPRSPFSSHGLPPAGNTTSNQTSIRCTPFTPRPTISDPSR